ncbi:MAG: hypothetical protein WAN51_15320, partial [Alphaproteobacteria bacterium]
MDDQIQIKSLAQPVGPVLPASPRVQKRPHRLWLIAVLIGILGVGAGAAWWIAGRSGAVHYTTIPVTRGTVART